MSACGFTPVHSREARAQLATELESVEIVTDRKPPDQMLKAEITDHVNPDARRAEKRFVMKIKTVETEVSVFTNPDGTASRGDMTYTSTYELSRLKDGKVIDKGTLTRVGSYNNSPTADYGTYVSREDARKRAMLELAQDYKLRLNNLLPKLNDPFAEPPKTDPNLVPLLRSPSLQNEDRTTGLR